MTVVSTMLRKGGRTVKVVKARGSFGLDNSNVREVVTIDLPVPPSMNGLYFNRAGGGRAKTEDYTNWLTEAGWRLQGQRPGRVSGPYSADLELPANVRGDVSNRFTAASDLLVKHGVVDDDRFEQDIRVRRSADVIEARITIRSVPKVST